MPHPRLEHRTFSTRPEIIDIASMSETRTCGRFDTEQPQCPSRSMRGRNRSASIESERGDEEEREVHLQEIVEAIPVLSDTYLTSIRRLSPPGAYLTAILRLSHLQEVFEAIPVILEAQGD